MTDSPWCAEAGMVLTYMSDLPKFVAHREGLTRLLSNLALAGYSSNRMTYYAFTIGRMNLVLEDINLILLS